MELNLKFRFASEFYKDNNGLLQESQKYRNGANTNEADANLEGEYFTGFFFDQRLLALYSRNSTGFDYLRVYTYDAAD